MQKAHCFTSCQVNFQGKNRTAFTFWHLLLCHPTFLRTGLWGWLIGGERVRTAPRRGWQSLLDREQGWWQHVSLPGGEAFFSAISGLIWALGIRLRKIRAFRSALTPFICGICSNTWGRFSVQIAIQMSFFLPPLKSPYSPQMQVILMHLMRKRQEKLKELLLNCLACRVNIETDYISQGNYIQYPGTNHDGKKVKKIRRRYVCAYMSHFAAQQKLTQHCSSNIPQPVSKKKTCHHQDYFVLRYSGIKTWTPPTRHHAEPGTILIPNVSPPCSTFPLASQLQTQTSFWAVPGSILFICYAF